MIGQKITCKIHGDFIEDGVVQVGSCGRYFICQNIRNGTNCSDKMGYNFSWVVNAGTASDLKNESVTDIALLDTTPKSLPIFN